MRARYWMIGCLIGLAGMGSAMAADFDACDATNGSRAAADSSPHDASSSGNGGGDVLGLNRDTASSKHGNDADGGDNDNRGSGVAGGSEHGGGVSAPTRARPATLADLVAE